MGNGALGISTLLHFCRLPRTVINVKWLFIWLETSLDFDVKRYNLPLPHTSQGHQKESSVLKFNPAGLIEGEKCYEIKTSKSPLLHGKVLHKHSLSPPTTVWNLAIMPEMRSGNRKDIFWSLFECFAGWMGGCCFWSKMESLWLQRESDCILLA